MIQYQLEAALHSKATSMATTWCTTKLIKAGNIEKFGRKLKSRAKPKWVELIYHSAEPTECKVNQAYLILNYADTKTSEFWGRYKVVRMSDDDGKQNTDEGSSFSVIVSTSAVEKELLLTCKNDQTKNMWVQA